MILPSTHLCWQLVVVLGYMFSSIVHLAFQQLASISTLTILILTSHCILLIRCSSQSLLPPFLPWRWTHQRRFCLPLFYTQLSLVLPLPAQRFYLRCSWRRILRSPCWRIGFIPHRLGLTMQLGFLVVKIYMSQASLFAIYVCIGLEL